MLTTYCLVIIAAALGGSALPLLLGRSEKVLHFLIALSTGIFLGVVFTHLLPEVAHMAEELGGGHAHAEAHADHLHAGEAQDHDDHDDHAGHGHSHGVDGAAAAPFLHEHAGTEFWLLVLVGLLIVYFVEKVVLGGHVHSEHEQHVTLGLASYIGLAVHAFTAGLGLAAALAADPHGGAGSDLSGAVFVGIISHKSAETFSLTSVLMLAAFSRKRVMLMSALFALVTPAGVLIGQNLFQDVHGYGVGVLVSLAAGSFLYVAVCDLLPEVFHHRTHLVPKVILVALGVGASLWI